MRAPQEQGPYPIQPIFKRAENNDFLHLLGESESSMWHKKVSSSVLQIIHQNDDLGDQDETR